MRKLNKSWMAVVAAALLLSTLVGVVWAMPSDRPGAAEATRKVTLTGADFIPRSTADSTNNGSYVECNTGNCFFAAPVPFPCLPSVTVELFKLHVRDDNGIGSASVYLYRGNPSTGGENSLGSVSSPPAVSGGLKTYTSAPINKVVWPSQRAYLMLNIWGPNITVYGVTVEYHINS